MFSFKMQANLIKIEFACIFSYVCTIWRLLFALNENVSGLQIANNFGGSVRNLKRLFSHALLLFAKYCRMVDFPSNAQLSRGRARRGRGIERKAAILLREMRVQFQFPNQR
ncbi:hypothetical protein CVN76_18965 [Bacillus sp. mrc49]|nr:hypothetical protein CVN76_18965 [Bacillus sp. mrc49]